MRSLLLAGLIMIGTIGKTQNLQDQPYTSNEVSDVVANIHETISESQPAFLLPNANFSDSPVIVKKRISFFKDDTTYNKGRFLMVAGSTLGALAASYVFANTSWWSGEKTSFHFDGGDHLANIFDMGRDAVYAKGLDKFGHFYGGIMAGDFFSQAVKWSGKSEKQSLIWGGIFSGTVQAFIEVKDGYAPHWGFSIYDFLSGTLGGFYPYFQSKSKFLKAIDVKLSYYKRDDFYFRSIGYTSGWHDDYMNQTYWFTFNPKRYKPQSKWPKWLGISAGFGVDNKLNNYYFPVVPPPSDAGKGGYEFYISPDIDFTGLLPNKPFWQRVAKILNYIKFPAPALRISNDSKFLPLFF